MLVKYLHFSVCEELKVTRQSLSYAPAECLPLHSQQVNNEGFSLQLLVRWVIFSLRGTAHCQTKRSSEESRPQLRTALARLADVVGLLQTNVTRCRLRKPLPGPGLG